MAYLVNNTIGTEIARVLDGQIDRSSTSIKFIGKSVTNYGEIQNENFLWLLENFAAPTDPANPIEGQIWWDSANKSMKVYIEGVGWRALNGFIQSATTPINYYAGDQWWDTTNEQYKIYNGLDWVLIGPPYSKVDGTSGAIVENIYDGSGTKHTVVKLYDGGTVTGIISKDSTFTPNVAITGFSTVTPGISLSTSVTGAKFKGTATDADSLGGVAATNYIRGDIDSTTTGNLTIEKNRLTLGVPLTGGQFAVSVFSGDTTITSFGLDKAIQFRSNVGGTLQSTLTIDGATGQVLVSNNPVTGLGVATKQYVDAADAQIRSDYSYYLAANIDIAVKNFLYTPTSGYYQPRCFVSPDAPNNSQGDNGDIWFRYY